MSKMATWNLRKRSASSSTTDSIIVLDSPVNAVQPDFIVLGQSNASLNSLSFELQQKEKVKRQEALERVGSLWQAGNQDTILSTINGIQLSRHDFGTLKDEEWLNDNIIDAYMALIMQRSQERPYLPVVYTFSTHFYTALRSQGYSKVSRWTSNINIFSYDVLFLPIHSGAHWTLLAFYQRKNKFAYFDSMASSDSDLTNSTTRYHVRNFTNYLIEESKNKRKVPYEKRNAKSIFCTNVPTQDNAYDCGAFVCAYVENMARGNFRKFTFTQDDLKYLRFKMCYELGIGRLLG